MINTYAKNTNPVDDFLKSIGVAKVDASGQATGTTGGNTFMWQDQQAQYQELLGAQTPTAPTPQSNAFLKPAAAPASPMAGNAFIGGAGDVRVNGLTPATLAPGGTPMVGRDYGTAQPMGRAGLGSLNGDLASEVAISDGPVARNGALFGYGAGQGFSITQDPMTVPAQGGTARPTGFTPEAAGIAYQGLSAGMDRNAFMAELSAGKFDQAVPSNVALTPMEQTARAVENAKIREQAITAFDRVASSGLSLGAWQDSGIRQNRNNAFMKALGIDQKQMQGVNESTGKRITASNKVREEGKEREVATTELFKLYQEREAFKDAGNAAMVKTYDQRIEKLAKSADLGGFFEALANLGRPGGQPAMNEPIAAPNADIPTLSPEEAAKLKPGTKFKTTDGRILTRQ